MGSDRGRTGRFPCFFGHGTTICGKTINIHKSSLDAIILSNASARFLAALQAVTAYISMGSHIILPERHLPTG
jgi:hypothetical protein